MVKTKENVFVELTTIVKAQQKIVGPITNIYPNCN